MEDWLEAGRRQGWKAEMNIARPVVLVILDGWGWREEPADNAVLLAATPAFDAAWRSSPHAFLQASGPAVGLPEGQMGNSEVGHLNIGAGRVVLQELPRIAQALTSGEVRDAPALKALVARLRETNGTCHLMGLVSAGGVHSHQDHMLALARLLGEAEIAAKLHAFTDGRDTPPRSALEGFAKLIPALPPNLVLATVSGRYFAMDRDRRWERVARAYDAIVSAEGERYPDGAAAISAAYGRDVSDEFIEPCVIGDFDGIADGDGVLCFNFRADRVREILGALLDPDFAGFQRKRVVRFAAAAGMSEYSAELARLMAALLLPQRLGDVLGEVVAKAGRTQLRMAETEKYAHVTYFLNGGLETPYPGEDRILVPSPKVATYDLKPEMSALELTNRAAEAIGSGKYDLIVINYANPDMVGHTGSLPAAIKAVETVDTGLGRLVDAAERVGGVLLVTADHGNCELMRDPITGEPHTAHTTNPVPIMLIGADGVSLADGRLADIAPTLLELMRLPQPGAMRGSSLLRGSTQV